ncbi:MAG: isoleucine--tRNA ligase [Microscillaceae bacterium]|nr:isoleucine--tRNA ligase [Microscillaceae bacterium]MDW8461517.1 isoleucine--tRNA ligase [Cytophagales bacterium]
MIYPNKIPSTAELEEQILAFWKENQIFEQSIANREGYPPFIFYEGPPSANGMPGIHHVMARTIKDIFCRFKTLQGFQVKRKAGWDTHGLPVELQVEKELGITKEDIGKTISIAEYNEKCRQTVMRYTSLWETMTEKMGYWVDMQHPYITYTNDYIESVWYLLKQLYQKGWLYKGYTIQPYSPKAGTGLSSHELNLPGCYRNVTDVSITAQFKVKYTEKSAFLFENQQEDVRILAWTTTPWTLPANCALAVGEQIVYQKIKTFNPYTALPVSVILAKDRISAYFNEKGKALPLQFQKGDKILPYQIVATYRGKDLEGVRYEQLMPYITNENLEKNAFRVILGDFVTTEDGTGVVHTASVFGADDFRVANQNGIPAVLVKDSEGNEQPLVNRQGQFVPELKEKMNIDLRQIAQKLGKQPHEYDLPKYMKPEYEEGKLPDNYLPSDVLISILLKEQNKAFKVEKYVHTYPHCWRTDKPILYYPLDSWFIRTTAVKERLAELNKTINWKPESTGTGRFGNWLENLVDWNLSRQRYWGIPLPIWRTADGKREICIGSIAELIEKGWLLREKANEYFNFDQLDKTQASIAIFPTSSTGNYISLQEIQHYIPDLAQKLDLHRPFVDEVVLIGEEMQIYTREKDLIDVWFDSGAMPYAQQHFPFEQNHSQTVPNFPADFISEGVDQTRGWFFTLHAIAGMLFDSVAFKNVVSTGLVLDKNGDKMSKRLGNVVEPLTTRKYINVEVKGKKYEGEYEIEGALSKYGADMVRWYMISNANPWDNLKFSWEAIYDEENKKVYGKSEGIEEVQRKLFGTLQNTYNFFALYANLDNYQINELQRTDYEQLPELDRWIISKLQTLIQEVTTYYNDYEPTKAARAIEEFVIDNLSNWYVRLSRKRFWRGEMTTDKLSAYETLQECLVVVAQLMSPIAPFFAEWLYQNMTNHCREQAIKHNTPLRHASVHLTDLVQADEKRIDKRLENAMALAQKIASLVHSIRKKHKLRVRLPLSRLLIPVLDTNFEQQVRSVEALILAEVNVKQVIYLKDDADILVKSAKPNFKTLGAKYKAQMKEVAQIIQQLDKREIATLEKEGKLIKNGFELTPEEVLIQSEDVKGLATATDKGITVALDLTLTPELEQEGFARDFVNRIQNLRKDLNLEVQDKIRITLQNHNDFVKQALQIHRKYVCTEVQALDLQFVPQLSDGLEVEVEEVNLKVKIEIEN